MPIEVDIKARRESPSFLARTSDISVINCSTCFCLSVCGRGRNSSFETICVGTGEITPFFASRSPFLIHIELAPLIFNKIAECYLGRYADENLQVTGTGNRI